MKFLLAIIIVGAVVTILFDETKDRLNLELELYKFENVVLQTVISRTITSKELDDESLDQLSAEANHFEQQIIQPLNLQTEASFSEILKEASRLQKSLEDLKLEDIQDNLKNLRKAINESLKFTNLEASSYFIRKSLIHAILSISIISFFVLMIAARRKNYSLKGKIYELKNMIALAEETRNQFKSNYEFEKSVSIELRQKILEQAKTIKAREVAQQEYEMKLRQQMSLQSSANSKESQSQTEELRKLREELAQRDREILQERTKLQEALNQVGETSAAQDQMRSELKLSQTLAAALKEELGQLQQKKIEKTSSYSDKDYEQLKSSLMTAEWSHEKLKIEIEELKIEITKLNEYIQTEAIRFRDAMSSMVEKK